MGIGMLCLVSATGLLAGRGFGDGKDLRKQLAAVIALFGTCQAICGFALPTRGLAMGSFDNTAGASNKGKEIISKPVKLMTKDIEVICKEVKDSIYQTYFYQ